MEEILLIKHRPLRRHSAQPIKNKKDIEKLNKYFLENNKMFYYLWVFGLNTGLRISDIVRLKVKDVRNKSHISVIEIKTGKPKLILINDKLKKILKEYINGKDNNDWLFPSKHGEMLCRRNAYRWINEAVNDLNIDITAGTHTMRKTFGYHHYQKFKDIEILRKIFNHSSSSITRRYIGIEQDEIDKSYKNFEL